MSEANKSKLRKVWVKLPPKTLEAVIKFLDTHPENFDNADLSMNHRVTNDEDSCMLGKLHFTDGCPNSCQGKNSQALENIDRIHVALLQSWGDVDTRRWCRCAVRLLSGRKMNIWKISSRTILK